MKDTKTDRTPHTPTKGRVYSLKAFDLALDENEALKKRVAGLEAQLKTKTATNQALFRHAQKSAAPSKATMAEQFAQITDPKARAAFWAAHGHEILT